VWEQQTKGLRAGHRVATLDLPVMYPTLAAAIAAASPLGMIAVAVLDYFFVV
jgi:hypothetical protein